MTAWVQRFLTALRARRNNSEHTLRAYAADLGEFAAFWEKRGGGEPAAMDRGAVRAWLMRLQERELARASVLRKVSALRSFCRFLREERALERDPFLNVPLPKAQRKLPRFLTAQEVSELLEKGAPGSDWVSLRDRAIAELLFSCGARRTEVERLSVPDVDFLGGTIRLYGKGSKERLVPIGDAALKVLRAYLAARPRPSEAGAAAPLWTNQRGRRLSGGGIALIVRRTARKAGLLKGLSPHALRHSFATALLDNGCGIRELQEMLGHSNIGSTQLYTHTTLEKLRAVYGKSHPRAGA